MEQAAPTSHSLEGADLADSAFHEEVSGGRRCGVERQAEVFEDRLRPGVDQVLKHLCPLTHRVHRAETGLEKCQQRQRIKLHLHGGLFVHPSRRESASQDHKSDPIHDGPGR